MDTRTAQPKARKKKFRELSPVEQDAAIEANRDVLTKHFDLQFTQSLNEEITELLEMYFRPQFVNFDELLERSNPEAPLIYACNHSGMAFPWDAIMFGSGLFKRHDYDLDRLFRPLASPALSASVLMSPFLFTNLWRRTGAINATTKNFETLMRYNSSNVLIYPEGVPGIGKGFNRRYQLQTFSTSMIRMAIKYRTEIVGVSCINGEYINPWSYSWKWLDKQINKIGIPYLPVALQTPLLLIQPWTFYYAFPAQLTYVRGQRFSPWELAGSKAWEAVTEADILRVRDEVQQGMQADLDQAVATYGKKPFHWKSFFKNLRKYWRDLPYWTPMGWPALFAEYERRYHEEQELPTHITRGWFKFWRIVWKNPITLAYFVPVLGWIPIMIKGMRGRKKVAPWEGPKA